jgi:hypothetical protein
MTNLTERIKKIAMVIIDFSKDNILPKLNRGDLAEIGKTGSKQVLLKKSVIERNIVKHAEVAREDYDSLIGQALYNSDYKFKGFKENYINFVKKISDKNNSLVLLDMDETKDYYEIVHVMKISNYNLKRMMKKIPK